MKILTAVFLLTGLSTVALAAETADSRFNVDFGYNEGKLSPEAFIPIRWNQHWFSGIGFSSGSTQSNNTIDGFTDSRIGTSIEDNRIRFNTISYENKIASGKWSVGADIELIDINKLEFGYFQLPASFGGTYVNFDNDISLEVFKPALKSDISWKLFNKSLDIRLGVEISVLSSLYVKQESRFIPIVSTTAETTSRTNQDTAYSVTLEMLLKTGRSVNIGLNASYSVLPLKYDLQVLNTSANGYDGTTIEEEQETTTISLRFVFTRKLINLHPVIGIKHLTYKSTSLADQSSSKSEDNAIIFGLENRF